MPRPRISTESRKTFVLDRGVSAYVYEKQSDFERADLEYLAEYFSRAYPGRQAIFADRILGHADIWSIQAGRNRSLAVKMLKWFLEKGIFSPEMLAAITNKTVEEVNMLVQ